MTGNGRIQSETLADKGSLVAIGPETAVIGADNRILDPVADVGELKPTP